MKEYLTTAELAEQLSLSAKTIQNKKSAGIWKEGFITFARLVWACDGNGQQSLTGWGNNPKSAMSGYRFEDILLKIVSCLSVFAITMVQTASGVFQKPVTSEDRFQNR